MNANLYVFLLGFCAVLISSLGAGFSVHGLASLFSGSFWAVTLMAGSLEFGKLVIAAFLHGNWKRVNPLLKTYMTLAVITLMCITSMGIFGFLSNSYQTSSLDINRINIQIEASEKEYARSNEELNRMYKELDGIPPDQTTKKLILQKRYEPLMADFTRRANDSLNGINNLKLEQLKSQSKVGPLMYVAKAFHVDIDTVVKWLIMVFVAVFDPLAVCLVIATSTAIRIRNEDRVSLAGETPAPAAAPAKNSNVVEMLEPEKVSA